MYENLPTMLELNKIYQGDCLVRLKEIPDESVDAIVTDPPYELGFMGKSWDASGIAYNVELCLRVLKPGGHLLAFGGTRTYHRMAVAIEDAGFEVRDMLEWIYFSGFPKSLNIGKAVDKKLGNEREITGYAKSNPDLRDVGRISKENCGIDKLSFGQGQGAKRQQTPIDKGNSEWEGFGTALKPAHEPIVMARKPLSEKTIVENVLKHGTGAIDIDGCRIPTAETLARPFNEADNDIYGKYEKFGNPNEPIGRFPANILCTDDALNDGTITKSTKVNSPLLNIKGNNYCNAKGNTDIITERGHNDFGSKSRYFDLDVWGEKYGLLQFPKASKKDRGMGNTHATVKPTHLISWLVRLVSKKGDLVLDPFMGSGTTAYACKYQGRNFIGFELNQEYIGIANARISQIALSQFDIKQE